MVAGLDSTQGPALAQAQAAFSAGVRVWFGYIATTGDGISTLNLLRTWTKAEFDVLKQAGIRPAAFCSGWDDAAGVRAKADAWGIDLLGIDVEDGIRGDGPWVPAFISAAGDRMGLYGNTEVFTHGYQAQWYQMAYYPGFDPGATWDAALVAIPQGPHAWQWAGTHQEFGMDVDRSWCDEWFASAPPPEVLDLPFAFPVDIAPTGTTTFRVPPPDKSGAVPFGDVYVSLGADQFGDATPPPWNVRVAISNNDQWRSVQTVSLSNGVLWVTQLQAQDQLVSVTPDPGCPKLACLVEIGAP